jgi:multiple sugar transport system substrate-binding protein
MGNLNLTGGFKDFGVSRRTVLKGVGAAAALPVLAACGSQSGAAPSASASAAGSAAPSAAASVAAGFTIDESMTTAQLAIALAKKYAGSTINWQVEAGTQGALWKSIKDQWEKETGTILNVLEVPYAEQFQRALAANQAGGGIDGLYVQYNWLPDFVNGGIIAPIDPYLDKYFTTPLLKEQLADFVPSIMALHTQWGGGRYGYPIDGPGFTLYYRRDIIEDADKGKAFQGQYGYPLAVPKTWEQYRDVATFITDTMGPKMYGGAITNAPQFDWMQIWNAPDYGDVNFFDAQMKPMINQAPGVKALETLKSLIPSAPDGSQSWGPIETWSLFLKGGLGMTVTWPPLGRLSEGYGAHDPLLNFVPPSTVVGKVGSALPPGGTMQDASGYAIGIASTSEVQELVFAFITWATAPDVSVALLSNPASFCRPVRYSSFSSPILDNLFPGAKGQYDVMEEGTMHLTPDLVCLNSQQYLTALGEGISSAVTGSAEPQAALDSVAEAWERLTDQVGREEQAKAYAEFQKNVEVLKST